MRLMRKFALLFCILAMPPVSFAQSKQASWANLSALHPDQKIRVVETSEKKHTGTFVSVSDTTITFHDNLGNQTIEKLNVMSVKLLENTHRVRNTLLGAAAGAGAGAGIGAAATGRPTNNILLAVSKPKGAAVGAVIGVAAGAAIGALWPVHTTIYNAAAH
ncbi:MAG TPA: hypothetical protein VIH72_05225 [Candidatus Acidoferrales bacterium]|jgi:hypothetical protein